PKDGLVLRQFVRDLGPKKRAMGDIASPWNTDMVWFTAAEAQQLLPAQPAKGAKHEVPAPLIRRLVRLHLLDGVLGQPQPFQPHQIEKATLTAEVTDVQGDEVTLRLTGATRAGDKEYGTEMNLVGKATFDRKKGRFTAFEMGASGTRWGALPR